MSKEVTNRFRIALNEKAHSFVIRLAFIFNDLLM